MLSNNFGSGYFGFKKLALKIRKEVKEKDI